MSRIHRQPPPGIATPPATSPPTAARARGAAPAAPLTLPEEAAVPSKLTSSPTARGTLAAPESGLSTVAQGGDAQDLDTHLVQPGEEDWSQIAAQYGIGAAALQQANPGARLAAGTLLQVPSLDGDGDGGQGTGGNTVSSASGAATAASLTPFGGLMLPSALQPMLPGLMPPCLLGLLAGLFGFGNGNDTNNNNGEGQGGQSSSSALTPNDDQGDT